jgi:hypothetical protein
MTAKKKVDKSEVCCLGAEVAEFKKRQARDAEIAEWNAEESNREFASIKTSLFYILAGVCLQVVLSLVLLYYVTNCGAVCQTHP